MANELNSDRRAAHERLATGSLARWARACASHPWHVVGAWGGIIVALVFLVAIGGTLKDEFEIPGTDSQRAIDLIESEFDFRNRAASSASSSPLPRTRRSESPSAGGASRRRSPGFRRRSSRPPRTRRVSRASATRSTRTRSPTTDESRMPRRSSTGSSMRRIATPSSPWRTPCARRSSRPA